MAISQGSEDNTKRKRQRRNSSFVKPLPENLTKEEENKLKLSESLEEDRNLKRKEIFMMLVAAVGSFMWNIGSFTTYRLDNKSAIIENEFYTSSYTAITVVVSIATIYHIYNRLHEYWEIDKQLDTGIEVGRHISRVYADAAINTAKLMEVKEEEEEDDDEDAESRKRSVEDEDLQIDETTPEFRIIDAKHEISNCKAMLKLAFGVDLLLMLLNFFRFFFVKIWTEDNVGECLTSGGVMYHCGRRSHFFAVMAVVSSLGSFCYRVSYYRDLQRFKKIVKETQAELTRQAMYTESILDKFDDVSRDEVNQVVVVRNILKNLIAKFAKCVFSDYIILGWLRVCKHDEIKTCQRIRECAETRAKYGLDAMREKILLNDWSVTMIPGIKRIKECWPGMIESPLGFGPDGKTMYRISMLNYAKIDKNILEARYHDVEKFCKDVLCSIDMRLFVQEAQAVKQLTCIRNVGIGDLMNKYGENKQVHGLRKWFHKFLVEHPKLTPFTHVPWACYYSINVNKLAVSMYNTIAKPLIPTADAAVLLPDNEEGKVIQTQQYDKIFSDSHYYLTQRILKEKLPNKLLPHGLGGDLKLSSPEIPWEQDPYCVLNKPPYDPRPSELMGKAFVLTIFKGVSDEEVDTVQKLIDDLDLPSNIPDDVMGPVRLLRMLKSCEGNVDKTKEKVLDCLAWRAENNVDVIRDHILSSNLSLNELPGYEKYMGGNANFLLHVNMEKVFQIRDWSNLHLETDGTIEEMTLLLNIYIEEWLNLFLWKLSRARRRIMVMDRLQYVKGTARSSSMASKTTIKMFTDTAKGYSGNFTYPTCIFGVNPVFTMAWKMVLPLLPSGFKNKTVLIPESDKGLKELLNYRPKQAIPRYLGGSGTNKLRDIDYPALEIPEGFTATNVDHKYEFRGRWRENAVSTSAMPDKTQLSQKERSYST